MTLKQSQTVAIDKLLAVDRVSVLAVAVIDEIPNADACLKKTISWAKVTSQRTYHHQHMTTFEDSCDPQQVLELASYVQRTDAES